jgi:hypothetical protein
MIAAFVLIDGMGYRAQRYLYISKMKLKLLLGYLARNLAFLKCPISILPGGSKDNNQGESSIGQGSMHRWMPKADRGGLDGVTPNPKLKLLDLVRGGLGLRRGRPGGERLPQAAPKRQRTAATG